MVLTPNLKPPSSQNFRLTLGTVLILGLLILGGRLYTSHQESQPAIECRQNTDCLPFYLQTGVRYQCLHNHCVSDIGSDP